MEETEAVRLAKLSTSNLQVIAKLNELYAEVITHDGFAELRVEIRILRRGQKEVILHCGKQYRFVVDCPMASNGTEQRVERRRRQESISFPDRRRRGRG